MVVVLLIGLYMIIGCAVSLKTDDLLYNPGSELDHPWDWLSTVVVIASTLIWPVTIIYMFHKIRSDQW